VAPPCPYGHDFATAAAARDEAERRRATTAAVAAHDGAEQGRATTATVAAAVGEESLAYKRSLDGARVCFCKKEGEHGMVARGGSLKKDQLTLVAGCVDLMRFVHLCTGRRLCT
jgi:hypothetical protein